MNFEEPIFAQTETPNGDWGLFPPNGLPSNNFSVIWEGKLEVPVDGDVDGWIGVATSANCTAKLYVDDQLVFDSPLSRESTIQSNFPGLKFTRQHSTDAPAGGSPFTFKTGAIHKIRLEFQAFHLEKDIENVQTFNSKVELFWNLVDRHNSIQKVTSAPCLTRLTNSCRLLKWPLMQRSFSSLLAPIGTQTVKEATARLCPFQEIKPC